MGKITIVNALGVDMKLVKGSPYNFNSTVITAGSSITAEVINSFDNDQPFILELQSPDGSRYRYNLNKDHWYYGEGEYHYPGPKSKVNIILRGDRSTYIETNYTYGPNDEISICNYSADTKALDKQ